MNNTNSYTCVDEAVSLVRELHEHVLEISEVVSQECKKQDCDIGLLKLLHRSSEDMVNACALIMAAAENCLSDGYVLRKIVDQSNRVLHRDADEEDSPVESDEPEQVCKIIDYSTKSVIT